MDHVLKCGWSGHSATSSTNSILYVFHVLRCKIEMITYRWYVFDYYKIYGGLHALHLNRQEGEGRGRRGTRCPKQKFATTSLMQR